MTSAVLKLLFRPPTAGLVFVLGMASITSASTITASLNIDGCSNGCGTSPFGSVTLTQDGSGVDVTVALLNSDAFVKTGAGESLEFDIAGNAAITITNLTTGFSNNGAAKASTFGSFENSIACSGCGPGGSNTLSGPLSFTVSLTGGGTLTLDDFVANSDGYFFTSDIIGTNGGTGNVASDDPGPPVPEPASLSLMGGSLIALGLLGRRLLAAKK